MSWTRSPVVLQQLINIIPTNDVDKELREQLERVIDFKFKGYSTKTIAILMNVSKSALYRLMEHALYIEMYKAVSEDCLNAGKSGLIGAIPTAVKVCADICDNVMIHPTDKLPAAKYILDFGMKVADSLEKLSNSSDEEGLVPVKRDG